MSLAYCLLRWGHRFPVHLLPFPLVLALHSWGRPLLWKHLSRHVPAVPFDPPPHAERRYWGLRFRCPVFNAAGLFKYGEGYELAYRQGAGAYLLGTITALSRRGRTAFGIRHPFMSFPRTRAALNVLGLPNAGHRAAAAWIRTLPRYTAFPLGISVALDPELNPSEALQLLLEGLRLYSDAGADFIEINESCPNIPHDPSWHALQHRLRWIADHFLVHRSRPLPVLVKVSVDTPAESLLRLLELLLELGYDGMTIGNTSTAYEALMPAFASSELRHYAAFWRRLGGGVSGAPLAKRRQQLLQLAAQWLAQHRRDREFHLLAVGGIMSPTDLQEALATGASLVQWYTGYIHALAHYGDDVYRWMCSSLAPDP